MQHRFFKGIRPQKYKKQVPNAPALIPISSGESIPSELLLSRTHFRFDSLANFEASNYIYKLLKKSATFKNSKIKKTIKVNIFRKIINKETLVALAIGLIVMVVFDARHPEYEYFDDSNKEVTKDITRN